MRYLSMFSGIEAATQAWHPLGWEPAAFAEIEKFPAAVLAHHYPETPNLGDVEKADFDAIGPVDLIVFGSPCQSYSIAGKRLGLDDPRGNLALVAGKVVYRKLPRWFVFENVPGLLSSDGGADFGTLLAAYSGHADGSFFKPPEGGWRNFGIVESAPNGKGYGLCWRVLDAQYVRVDGFERAVPQRRRRLFIVGYIGDWRPAAAVLFEPESMRGDSPPRRQAGQEVAGCLTKSLGSGGADDNRVQARHLLPFPAEVTGALDAHFGSKQGLENQHVDNGCPLFVPFNSREDCITYDGHAGPLGNSTPQAQAIVYPINTQMALRGPTTSNSSREGIGLGANGDPSFTLQAAHSHAVATGGNGRQVRRLTPVECARLQGFPDNFTRIPWRGKPAERCPDGLQYKALGNSMAVNVMRWIGRRIEFFESIEELK